MKNQTRGHAMTMPGGIVYGAGISFVWTLISAGILAYLIHKEIIAENGIGYGSMVILLLGSALGSYIGWKKVMCKRLITAVSVGLLYLILLMGLTALFFGGQYQGIWVTGLLIMGGSLLSVLIMPDQKHHKQGSVRKIRR